MYIPAPEVSSTPSEPKNRKVYTKQCKCCGMIFNTLRGNVQLCPDCKNMYYGKRKSTAKTAILAIDVSINNFVALTERYNKNHGTRYSYGQMKLALDTGKVSKEEFLND